MPASRLRRVVIVILSALLPVGVIGLTPSAADPIPETPVVQSIIKGRVLDPSGQPALGIVVTLSRLTTSTSQPWRYSASLSTYGDPNGDSTQTDPAKYGTFEFVLGPGTYRVAINANSEHLGMSRFYQPLLVGGDSHVPSTTGYELAQGQTLDLGDQRLEYLAGSVSGRVTDFAGKPLKRAEVMARYYEPYQSTETLSTTTDDNGDYTIATADGPTTITVASPSKYMSYGQVTDGTSTTPRVFNLAPGEHVTGADVIVRPKPIRSSATPRVTGTLKVGRSLKTTGGVWIPSSVAKKYQWYRVKGGKTIRIPGATKYHLRMSSRYYGNRFKVLVTASTPGTPSVKKWSSTSGLLGKKSSVKVSASPVSMGRADLSARVSVSGGGTATGSVRFTCRGSTVVVKSRSITLKKGKASTRIGLIPNSSFTCTGTYSGSSKVLGSSSSKKFRTR